MLVLSSTTLLLGEPLHTVREIELTFFDSDGDCKTFNPTAETKWYKVFQEGLIDVENTKFATSQMVDS